MHFLRLPHFSLAVDQGPRSSAVMKCERNKQPSYGTWFLSFGFSFLYSLPLCSCPPASGFSFPHWLSLSPAPAFPALLTRGHSAALWWTGITLLGRTWMEKSSKSPPRIYLTGLPVFLTNSISLCLLVTFLGVLFQVQNVKLEFGGFWNDWFRN